MKKFLLFLSLLALAVPAAWAQNQPYVEGQGANYVTSLKGITVGGILTSDSTYKVMRLDSNGNLMTVETAPLGQTVGTWPLAINNASIAAFTGADSSAILSTIGYGHYMLYIKAVPSLFDTTCGVVTRLAFQVRGHLAGQSDSSSTFAFYTGGSTGVGVSAGASPDSLTEGHLATGGLGVTAQLPWSGEFVVSVMSCRKAHSGTGIGDQVFYYPNGIAIPVDNLFGREFRSDYTSIRVRNLTAGTCAVAVTLKGYAL